MEVPSECKESHKELIENFTRLSIDQINVFIDDLA
jgi:uncharacterized alkaline shock family protein YloU